MTKINLLGMNLQQLQDFFTSIGEKPFRAKQLLQWIHQRQVDSFVAMTNLSKALREKLTQIAEIRAPILVGQEVAEDSTIKYLMQLPEGGIVETVLIPAKNGRRTLCVSTQIGCSLNCSFCATGKQGFERNLTASEIIGQVWLAVKQGGAWDNSKQREVTNVVLMGMGEPLMNYKEVLPTLEIMMHDLAYGLSKRRVTVSTAGLVPMIDKLGDDIDVSLAISLHASNDETRNILVPLNRKYNLEVLIAAAKRFLSKHSERKTITIEYTLIDKVNDSDANALELAEILRDLPCKINIIPVNPFFGSEYKRPSMAKVVRFSKILESQGHIVTLRTTRGDDIAAACGQLVGKVKDRTNRSAKLDAKNTIASLSI